MSICCADKQYVVKKCPYLINEMVNIVAQLVALAHGGRGWFTKCILKFVAVLVVTWKLNHLKFLVVCSATLSEVGNSGEHHENESNGDTSALGE